ncbi:imidazoleglycerol-phosphate synthase, cyclase subunit F [Thermococcus onnurineus NA1]|uniref:Imidazole glycerol phosphate synthase subunit HisF n=1 Tax=Thermococcus onnurineus (strain NA1) TaxID=523850 RepID=HIS6_THEON|nr:MULTISPECIES: imidazole glycerol phosphate synthase subunit HisF [Thermococcus]B6YWA9.1 RecName: Full=Imidazole glycerol phosphate synthase subunit HisF; AltName: Full=IGP synthase cyclase subunit; AltName: Full=IGP synthase subunit HisF; AltName: Full=ImGP synthase subunit HisF; Short=IGPS subunit HisF [Thermococcus onnurineus NA1]ACJ16372.1 imidazoleglycerol-phosphate synthase, cyclase subunit F [Thermococcus onnurineus NA1]NJE47721.1 imidazole glycerol phosphate synthase subunit HisF [Ther
MLAKRIIAALDIKEGRVVKGIKFQNIRDAGDPIELARRYEEEGIDEIVFLDITASFEKRKILLDLVKRIAEEIYVPFTVGGGIKSVEEIREIIKSGADKVFLNTAAVNNPELVREAAKVVGSANLVIAIDAKWNGEYWEVYTHGGRKARGINAVEWAKEVERLGAGEILLTSMDTDGTQEGFDIPLTKAIVEAVDIPVIASGGAGSPEHFYEAFKIGAEAALAASIFHYGKYTVRELKEYLAEKGIPVRLNY